LLERDRPKKENILDLAKYMDKRITVKFNGGREGESGDAGDRVRAARANGLVG
jgi:hypothetical protein